MNPILKTKPYAWAKPIRSVEYDLRHINANGDAFDVHHCNTRKTALEEAAAIKLPDGETVALVVERHHVKTNFGHTQRDDLYETIATYGDKTALIEGGWLEA